MLGLQRDFQNGFAHCLCGHALDEESSEREPQRKYDAMAERDRKAREHVAPIRSLVTPPLSMQPFFQRPTHKLRWQCSTSRVKI